MLDNLADLPENPDIVPLNSLRKKGDIKKFIESKKGAFRIVEAFNPKSINLDTVGETDLDSFITSKSKKDDNL